MATPLRQLPAGVIELVWVGLLEPDFALPPLLGVVLMRSTIEDQFLGMVREIGHSGSTAVRGRASAVTQAGLSPPGLPASGAFAASSGAL